MGKNKKKKDKNKGQVVNQDNKNQKKGKKK